MGFSEQPASPTAVHLPPVGGLAEPRLAGSGRTPDPLYWRKKNETRGNAPQKEASQFVTEPKNGGNVNAKKKRNDHRPLH